MENRNLSDIPQNQGEPPIVPDTLKATVTSNSAWGLTNTFNIGVYRGFQSASDDIDQLAQQLSELEIRDPAQPVNVEFVLHDLAPVSETVRPPSAHTVDATLSKIDINLVYLGTNKRTASLGDKAAWGAFVHDVLRMLYNSVISRTAERRVKVRLMSGIATDDAIIAMQVVRVERANVAFQLR